MSNPNRKEFIREQIMDIELQIQQLEGELFALQDELEIIEGDEE